MGRITKTVKAIIIINVILWVITILLFQARIIDLNSIMALHFFESPDYGIWQFITHVFMHASINVNGQIVFTHILFNMVGIWMFGSALEQVWGRNKFLFFYISAGLGAALVHFLVTYSMQPSDFELINGQMVGASGALYGLLVAFAMSYPNSELMLIFLPIPIKAKYFVPLIIVGDVFFGFTNTNTGIAHFAHIGGALIGFIMMWYWKKNQFNKNRWN